MTEQPTPSGAPPVSTGTLFYLYGDHVVAAAGRMAVGVDTPYSGAKVNAADLSAVAFAASFWSLREAGALHLHPVTRKVLLVSRPDVQLRFGGNLAHRSGFEDVIMRAVSEGRDHAYDVVRDWFDRDVSTPEVSVFAIAKSEMVQHGLGRDVDAGRGAVGGFFLGKTRLEPDPDAIRGQWETFWRAHQGWQQFWQTEQPLATSLVEACRRAIRSREEHDTRD